MIGVLAKRVFLRGVLVVSLWWVAWWDVVFRGVFLNAEKYANFSDFIFVGGLGSGFAVIRDYAK